MLRIELSDYKNRTYLSAIEAAKYLVDYIDDTERIPKTQPQIEYRYICLRSI